MGKKKAEGTPRPLERKVLGEIALCVGGGKKTGQKDNSRAGPSEREKFSAAVLINEGKDEGAKNE